MQQERDTLDLRIEDDGGGLGDAEKASKGMGLRVMAYRAGIIGGSLELAQHGDGGVAIICRVRLK